MDKRITAFIIGLLVIVAGIFVINSFLKDKEEPQPSGSPEALAPSIVVPNQAGGTKIFIERAVFPSESSASPSQGGYVVIYKDDAGVPGAIIGSSLKLPSGVSSNFLVDIKETVKAGDILYVMLHADNGDGTFTPADDIPILGGDEKPVMTKFFILDQGALEEEIKL